MAGSTSLLTYFKRPNHPSMRLFCFPYAGRGASMFSDWGELLPSNVELIGIQFPGRETRINEIPFGELRALLDEVLSGIRNCLNLPFAFFGHSMGALVGFELARLLRNQDLPQPAHLFASGYRAPQLEDPDPPIYNLPEHEFLMELQKLGGTPRDFLDYPELMDLLIPVIRQDIALCQTYAYKKELPLHCSISAFGGSHDRKLTRFQIEGWKEQTVRSFELKMFSGDHFFFQKNKTLLLQIISDKLIQLQNNYFYG